MEQDVQHLGAGSVPTVRHGVLVYGPWAGATCFPLMSALGVPAPTLSMCRKGAATLNVSFLESTAPLTGTQSDFRGNLL